MWIKEKPIILGESSSNKVNFLFNKDKIFLMDNHLSATWCWLQKIDFSKKYNFVHIDRHYDLLDFPEVIKEDLIEKDIDIKNITFEDYINLKQTFPQELAFDVKLFRWDNYIMHFQNIYPNLIEKTYFITKKIGAKNDFVNYECEIEEFITDYDYWLDNNKKNGWIINIDIDFFFSNCKGYLQLYSNEVVEKVAENLMQNLHKIDVLTICLSPECCGGWENSIRVFNIFNRILNLDVDI